MIICYVLPFLAVDPPTIRLIATFVYPHPSVGVSKRPLIFVLTTFAGGDETAKSKEKSKTHFVNINEMCTIHVQYTITINNHLLFQQ